MSRNARVPVPTTPLDPDSTLVVVLELSARSSLVGARVPSCLVAERYWDQARWAIEAYAWRFDGLGRAKGAA